MYYQDQYRPKTLFSQEKGSGGSGCIPKWGWSAEAEPSLCLWGVTLESATCHSGQPRIRDAPLAPVVRNPGSQWSPQFAPASFCDGKTCRGRRARTSVAQAFTRDWRMYGLFDAPTRLGRWTRQNRASRSGSGSGQGREVSGCPQIT